MAKKIFYLCSIAALGAVFAPVIYGPDVAGIITLVGLDLPHNTLFGWLPMACPLFMVAVVMFGEFSDKTKILIITILSAVACIGWAEGIFAAVDHLRGMTCGPVQKSWGPLLGVGANLTAMLTMWMSTLAGKVLAETEEDECESKENIPQV